MWVFNLNKMTEIIIAIMEFVTGVTIVYLINSIKNKDGFWSSASANKFSTFVRKFMSKKKGTLLVSSCVYIRMCANIMEFAQLFKTHRVNLLFIWKIEIFNYKYF